MTEPNTINSTAAKQDGTSMSGLYEQKTTGYFTHCRTDLLELLPLGKNSMLEVGAGSGDTLLKAKELGLATTVVGVELMPVVGGNQSHPALDRFIIGDIEKLDLDFEESSFDVILCGDVLEHLVDPWGTVKKLSRYLNPGGVFIASIPNVREIKNLIELVLHGDFKYADAGIMDRSHLRFFCKKNIHELFEQNGLRVQSVGSNLDRVQTGRKRIIDRLTFRLFHDLLVEQYYIVAGKANGEVSGQRAGNDRRVS